MDANFSFPTLPAIVPRPPKPPRSVPESSAATAEAPSRNSNALRASVLDAALQLGIGKSSIVADWIFNNPVEEEDERESPQSPGLTNETSEESAASSAFLPSTPPSANPPSSRPFALPSSNYALNLNGVPFVSGFESKKQDEVNSSVTFPTAPVLPRPSTPSRGKLRKKRADGYESDGGYMSESGKKKKKEKEKKDVSSNGPSAIGVELSKKEREKEAKARAKEEKMQEKREKEEERKRKKSLMSMAKDSKKMPPEDRDLFSSVAYQTDGGTSSGSKTLSKSKTKKAKPKRNDDVGYETDAGYLSTPGKSKSKTRFFRLGGKQSKADLRAESPSTSISVETTIDREPPSLPVAEKFATTLAPASSAPPFNMPVTASSTTSSIVPAFSLELAPPSKISLKTSFPPILPSIPASPSLDTLTSTVSSSTITSTPITAPPSFSPPSSGISPPPTSYRSPSPMSWTQPRPPSQSTKAESTIGHESLATSRESIGSGESASSSSSNPRRRAFHFGFSGVGTDTSNESTASPINSPTQIPLPSSASSTASSARFPPISLPLTRASGPAPIPGSSLASSRPPTTPSDLRALSPHPPVPRSNANSRASSPSVLKISSPAPSQGRPSPVDTSRIRPTPNASNMLSPHQAMRPRENEIMHHHNSSELSIVPSSEYIVPSPRETPLASPNVLSYYDIPPPSPPPSGPLPSVPNSTSTKLSPPLDVRRSATRSRREPIMAPPPAMANGGIGTSFAGGPGPLSRRSSDVDMSRTLTPDQGLLSQPIPNIQRGKEAPFPARPILPEANARPVNITLESRVRVPRYRDLYAIGSPPGGWARAALQNDRGDDVNPKIAVVEPTEDGWYDSDEDDEEDMRHVLDRFVDDSTRDRLAKELEQDGAALERSRSFEAVRRQLSNGRRRNVHADDDEDEDVKSGWDPDMVDTNMNGDEDALDRPDEGRRSSSSHGHGTTDNNRNSRWSGSIYSRTSFLDPDKSEEARSRFLHNVQNMSEDNDDDVDDYYTLSSLRKRRGLDGVGRAEAIPPVPKIPGYLIGAGAPATAGRTGSRI